jgi:hypothetical protein
MQERKLMSTTVQVLENTPERRSGTESLTKVFLRNNSEQIYFILLFCLSHEKKMRSGTHLTQQNMFLSDRIAPFGFFTHARLEQPLLSLVGCRYFLAHASRFFWRRSAPLHPPPVWCTRGWVKNSENVTK